MSDARLFHYWLAGHLCPLSRCHGIHFLWILQPVSSLLVNILVSRYQANQSVAPAIPAVGA